ncbi:MAG: hypothetical protein C7B45_04655 [Sulfobacillus acidophilus]|uniref:Uncharacterized protein n=1 Tax=Sulfobacillus acidophilus TaxID=53633 RepID=A0A2T2WKY7_9FIRM|nr:MAG: hypothetical protein C7B45_04655 [Sulfobacillus acidophilus]
MAIVYWKLGHLTAQGFQEPIDSFLVFRDGRVFDVDSHGWDLGIRPGDDLAEMKWRYPGATQIPWQAVYYRQLLLSLQEWLRHHAVSYQQTDPREGWWEWPRLAESDWRQLMGEIVPRWAQRVQAGVASHPWLAHWIAEEGRQLKLSGWDSFFGETYILDPEKEKRFWLQLPLGFVEGVSVKTRQQWHKRHWTRVQDVPGLFDRLHAHEIGERSVNAGERIWMRRFDDPVEQGVGEILRELAGELQTICRSQNQGVRFLRVVWFRKSGIEQREREWPTLAGDGKTVMARVLSLLSHPPKHPFDEVQLVVRLEPLAPMQLEWWESSPDRSVNLGFAGRTRFLPERREVLLQYWDPWRMAGGDGP